MTREIRLNYRNIARIGKDGPAHYSIIRFDSNNQCNVQCAYCAIPRSDDFVDLDGFRSFLEERVLSVGLFQFGCRMEPTLDSRLCDFMRILSASHARPNRGIRLQTNGILLHRHAAEQMAEAGLEVVTVSVDSINPATQKALRGGTSLAKVQRNVLGFVRSCPAVRMAFITVVTSENIDEIDDLVAWGVDAGVAQFEFRQVTRQEEHPAITDGSLDRLFVTAEQFAAMRGRIEARFRRSASLHFLPAKEIRERAKRIDRVSFGQTGLVARPA